MPVITEALVQDEAPNIRLDGTIQDTFGGSWNRGWRSSDDSLLETKYEAGVHTTYSTVPGGDRTTNPYSGQRYRLNYQGSGSLTTLPTSTDVRVAGRHGKALDMARVNADISIDVSDLNTHVTDEISFAWRSNQYIPGNGRVLMGYTEPTPGNSVKVVEINSYISSAAGNRQVYCRLGNNLNSPRNGRMDRARYINNGTYDHLINDDLWVCTKSITTGRIILYRNGVEVENKSINRGIDPLSSLVIPAKLGVHLYDLKAYSRALTPLESANPPEVDPDLRFWFDFNEGNGDLFISDRTGNLADIPFTRRYPNNFHALIPGIYHQQNTDLVAHPEIDITQPFSLMMMVGVVDPTTPQCLFNAFDGTRGFFVSTTSTGNIRFVYITGTGNKVYEVISSYQLTPIIARALTISVGNSEVRLYTPDGGVVSTAVQKLATSNFDGILKPGLGLNYDPPGNSPVEVINDATGHMYSFSIDFGTFYGAQLAAAADARYRVTKLNGNRYLRMEAGGVCLLEPGHRGNIYGTIFMVVETSSMDITFLCSAGDVGIGIGAIGGNIALILDGLTNVVSTTTLPNDELVLIAMSSSENVNEIKVSVNGSPWEVVLTGTDHNLPIDVLGHHLNSDSFEMRELRVYIGAELTQEEFDTRTQVLKSIWGIT